MCWNRYKSLSAGGEATKFVTPTVAYDALRDAHRQTKHKLVQVVLDNLLAEYLDLDVYIELHGLLILAAMRS